ncbi:MAG: hypothetical protein JKY88_15695 [Pseudomonadales bacterium]|nr:hypothetical protein [Pseudomonadales bacterium]
MDTLDIPESGMVMVRVSEIDTTFIEISGGTRVEIHNAGLQKQESVKNHDVGWHNYAGYFIAFLARQ